MTFFSNTKIETWQNQLENKLRLAFQESRKRGSVSLGDKALLKGHRRSSLLAVNRHSRVLWGEVISSEISKFFCEGGDGTEHNQEIYFVTLTDVSCARSPTDELDTAALTAIKNRLRYGLRNFSYLGMIEPAYYVNLQSGTRFAGKRCMYWHLHALVWGVSRKQLRAHLRKLVAAGRYVAVADGVKPVHSSVVKQGRLPKAVAYMLKSPTLGYRLSARDLEDDIGQPVTDDDGVVLQGFRQGKAKLRSGQHIELFHSMKHLYLDQLAIAGGEGARLLPVASC
jgi:hypothetical protein